MLKLLRSAFRPSVSESSDASDTPASPPTQISSPGASTFNIGASLVDAAGFPIVDWAAPQAWVESIPDGQAQREAWSRCERAWLEHLRSALRPSYRVRSQGTALLLSSLPANVADATLSFVNMTTQRIVRVLDGVAQSPKWGHVILIVLDDEESYYRYVSHYYPEEGEFAASSGIYINHGCGHFVTVKADLQAVEPIIAHELTHACLGHLRIPAWLNEGLAVNTELRLCPPPRPPSDLRRQHARHQRFWQPELIQEFWSGTSFLRGDEGNELSYDLARILVSQFATDWDRFRRFALSADLGDAAATSAKAHLGIELGAAVCAVLEGEPGPAWAPRPESWQGMPERGAF